MNQRPDEDEEDLYTPLTAREKAEQEQHRQNYRQETNRHLKNGMLQAKRNNPTVNHCLHLGQSMGLTYAQTLEMIIISLTGLDSRYNECRPAEGATPTVPEEVNDWPDYL